MVQRRDLNLPPGKSLAQKVAELRDAALSSKTGAHGTKDLGDVGDIVWEDTRNGLTVSRSVKNFAVELDDTAARAAELQQKIESAQAEINAATDELADALVALDNVGSVQTQGPPPVDPVIGKTLWVAPNGRVFKAVACPKEDTP